MRSWMETTAGAAIARSSMVAARPRRAKASMFLTLRLVRTAGTGLGIRRSGGRFAGISAGLKPLLP